MWTITKEWQGESAFIIAGGPSVRGLDLTRLAGRRVIAVNSSYEIYPAADFLFFMDLRWWLLHESRPAMKEFKGRIASCSKSAKAPGMLKLARIAPGTEGPGFAVEPTAVAAQRTCLQGAMNMAAHLGVNRIVLLGADMGRDEQGRSHHHVPHPWQNKPGNRTWDIQMIQLRMIAAPLEARGVKVLNASAASRIDWWPKASFEEALVG